MSRTEWLQGFGHEVLILQANRVRAFVRGNKNDAHDARAQAQNYPALALRQRRKGESRGHNTKWDQGE